MTTSASTRQDANEMPTWVRRFIGQPASAPRLSRSDLAHRRDDLAHAYQKFEAFVQVIQEAEHAGPTDTLEGEFVRTQSAWLSKFSPLQVYVSAYLRPDAADYESEGDARTRSDVFDRLSRPKTLEEWLAQDDGNSASRIGRAREALALYAEHLRLLSSPTRR